MKITDYHDPVNHGKNLWLVYGQKLFPSILCCQLKRSSMGPAIWGFSVYRRSPGFRTVGREVDTWIEELKARGEDMFELYDSQEEALQRLGDITTPNAGALKRQVLKNPDRVAELEDLVDRLHDRIAELESQLVASMT